MDDYISRQAVLAALQTCYDTECLQYENGAEYIEYGQALSEVENLPSADVRENHTGVWIQNTQEAIPPWINYSRIVFVCDRCGAEHIKKSNFCPYCGSYNRSEK